MNTDITAITPSDTLSKVQAELVAVAEKISNSSTEGNGILWMEPAEVLQGRDCQISSLVKARAGANKRIKTSIVNINEDTAETGFSL